MQFVQSPLALQYLQWIENATVDLVVKDADMMTLLDKIHDQTGITILREGAPIHSNANFALQGPLKDALDQIANTFDYTWVPSRKLSKSLLFKKRFRSLEEHPEWQEKEMWHVAEQVCRALQSPLAISEPYGTARNLLHLLCHKFSPQQLEFLYEGGRLSFQDLDASQALLLNQQIYCVALGKTTNAWQHLQYRLAHLSEAKLVLRPSDDYKALTLLFPPVGEQPETATVRYYTDENFAPRAPEASVTPVNLERFAPLSVQASIPENQEQTALQTKVAVRMQGGRLMDLLREVSQRSGCKITVADYLQQQHLSLWTKGCSVRLLMDLLAEQNEWEWTYRASKDITIARRDTFVPLNLTEVSAAFMIAMPPGYRHFLGWGVSADDWLKETEDQDIQFKRDNNIPGWDTLGISHQLGKEGDVQ